MHLRTPWDKPTTTTEPVAEDGEVTMTKPAHPYIPVTEVTICELYSHRPVFKLSFINMKVKDLNTPDDEGNTEPDRALRRRGFHHFFYADLSTLTPRRVFNHV